MSAGVVQLDQMTIAGESRGGLQTWFRVQPPGIAFDVGHGPPALTGVGTVFLSHGHLDHAGGLPILLSQRALHGAGDLEIYAPGPLGAALEEYLAAAARLEKTEYHYSVRGLENGDEVEVGSGYAVRSFATSHSVPALGFHLVQRVERLRTQYRRLDGREIAKLRRQGARVGRMEERLLVSYLGDTTAAVFDDEPAVLEARVLLTECTFVAPGDKEKAELYGHLHIDDLVAVADRFKGQLMVLHHVSRRSSLDDLEAVVRQRMPGLAPRIRILGQERDG